MAWIQVHQQLKDHRKLLAAADELETEPAHMLGLLISFWLWALDNAPTGSLAGISTRTIARAAQWSGNAEELVDALTLAGFLDTDDTGELEIHDWYEYTGKLIDQREAEKIRSRNRRAAKQAAKQVDRMATAGQTADEPKNDSPQTVGRVDQSRVDKTIPDKSRDIEPKGSPAEAVPYQQIVDMYHDYCPSYPTLRNISSKRKQAMAARWKEYKKDAEIFRELFQRAESSSFLKGKNQRNWTADFNWLMNSENMAKVLEGKYDDQQPAHIYAAAPRTNTGKPDTMGVLASIIADEEGGTQI